jgi:hypothetical protein
MHKYATSIYSEPSLILTMKIVLNQNIVLKLTLGKNHIYLLMANLNMKAIFADWRILYSMNIETRPQYLV